VFTSSSYDHVILLLHQLHCLKATEWIDYKLAGLVFKCLHGTTPPHLGDKFYQPADNEARRRLHSASSSSLVVRCTHLSTIGDCCFPVAGAHVWNSLSWDVTSAPCLPVFCRHLKSHLYRRCFHRQTVLL